MLMKGYRIPAKNVRANDQLNTLSDLVPASSGKLSGPNKRGLADVLYYTAWSAYNPGGLPGYSSDFSTHRNRGEHFATFTKSLWAEASAYLKAICPGQYRELSQAQLPRGTRRLAGVWAGVAVNRGSEEAPVQTNTHRDHKSVFFGKSCLYPFGDFTGGAVVLWELRAILELNAGDIFLFEDHLLTHSNEDVTGMRHSLVAFTHQQVLNWHNTLVVREDKKRKKIKSAQLAYQAGELQRKKEAEKRRRKRENQKEVSRKGRDKTGRTMAGRSHAVCRQ
jgi:hypothetical protein